MPSPVEIALTQLRDNAHLNQAALAAVLVDARAKFDAMRLWDDSPTKKGVLGQLGTLIQAYENARREAGQLRDRCNEALATLTQDVPPLPDPGGGGGWAAEEW